MHTNPTPYVVRSSTGKYVKDPITGKRWYWNTLEEAKEAAQGLNRDCILNDKRNRYQARVI